MKIVVVIREDYIDQNNDIKSRLENSGMSNVQYEEQYNIFSGEVEYESVIDSLLDIDGIQTADYDNGGCAKIVITKER